MADKEPKPRFPRQQVAEGQEHGYIGDVEVYDEPGVATGGSSNVAKRGKAAEAEPEKPVVGESGAIVADEGK